MNLHQLRLAALKVGLPLLAIFSWVSMSLVLETRPQHIHHDDGDGAAAEALSSIARLPASLPSSLPGVFSASALPVESPRMELLRLSCWDSAETKPFQADARWIRLSGRPCQHEVQAESIQVRNLTNGYVATVFVPQDGVLTTDYIPLESGKNDLLLRFDQGQGVTFENQITVNR